MRHVSVIYDSNLREHAENKKTQNHVYAGEGNDSINLIFDQVTTTNFSHGHHARGETGDNEVINNGTYELGQDVFNFTGFENLQTLVSGRIEDFDYSRDDLQINGDSIDLYNLPSNVRIVEYNGDHNDVGALPQQYILIDTGSGYLFYALEGARIDMDGNGAGGEQERHFLENAPDISTLVDVDFIDQKNVVPADSMPNDPANFSGMIYNDLDKTIADVEAEIVGTGYADLIAGGLNDDIIKGQNGNDSIWGGSGHDYIYGGGGRDVIEGGSSDDTLLGQGGNDSLEGQWGNDSLLGHSGNDTLKGGSGADTLKGGGNNDLLEGGSENDKLYGNNGADTLKGGSGSDYVHGGNGDDELYGGNGSDKIVGGSGADVAYGGSGADTFVFGNNQMVNFYGLSGSNVERYQNIDLVADYDVSADHIDLSGITGVNSLDDITVWKPSEFGGGNGEYFAISITSTGERILVDLNETGVTYSEFTDTLIF